MSIAPVVKFTIPFPPIPRPGERVFFFSEKVPHKGELLAYNVNGFPILKTDFDTEMIVHNYSQIRLEKPHQRRSANFTDPMGRGLVIAASTEEILIFNNILGQAIPPGPSYMDLISEIWNRGFEIYVVGGTVRDILCGAKSKDVDLITTMPIPLCEPLIHSMFGSNCSSKREKGYIRIGGKPKGEPFIDLKNFFQLNPGTKDVRFGSDFFRDICYRDFSCNSIYYDPINNLYIDPSGIGINDAKYRQLNIVNDISLPIQIYHRASIVIRFFKFVSRGYGYSYHTLESLKAHYFPHLGSMSVAQRMSYFATQVVSKNSNPKEIVIEEFKGCLIQSGCEDEWKQYFEPHITRI